MDFPTQCYQHVFEHLSQIHHFRHEISFGVPEKRKICLHSFYINIKLVNAGVTQPHAIRAGLFSLCENVAPIITQFLEFNAQ